MYRAPNYTVVPANSSTGVSIAGGSTVVVYGIVAAGGGGAGLVTVNEADDSTLIQNIEVPTTGSVVHNISFIADNGIAVRTEANVTCTVYHGNPGA
jgi:hypothetical protein